MILGRVVGELWATRKHPGLAGAKLLIVQPHLWYGPPFEVAHVVAIDTLGAGEGEDVIVCLGEPARKWLAHCQGAAAEAPAAVPGYAGAAWLPVEAAVMAIVDRVDVGASPAELPGQRPLRFIGPAPVWAAGPLGFAQATATTTAQARATATTQAAATTTAPTKAQATVDPAATAPTRRGPSK